MIQAPGFLLTVAAFVLVIGPLVFVHEMGHYLAGRWFGVKADAFSIGFGREVAGWTDRRGTRWKLGWLPLGGYVKFAGDMNPASQPDAAWLALPAEERARTFQAKRVWQRAIIVAAGPIVNFAAAVVILAGFAFFYGVNATPAVVGAVEPGSAAAAARLLPGDRIIAVGGRGVETFADLRQYVALRPGERVRVDVIRGGAATSTEAVIGTLRQADNFGNRFEIGLLGVAPTQAVFQAVPLWKAPGYGVQMTAQAVQATAVSLWQLVTGRRSVDELRGPLGMAKMSGEQLALGWPALVAFIAAVSINLGFINLLPIPMLDGGHLLFYAVEAVRRRPVAPEVMEWAFRGGLAALLALMLFVTLHNDLGSFGLWKNLAGLIG